MAENPGDPWHQIRQLTAAGQLSAAQTMLEAMLVRVPSDTTARLYLAGLLGAQDRQRAAVAQTLTAARYPPGTPRLLGDLIAALIWAGELVAARHFLDSPLFASSTSVPVLMRAAGQRQEIGDHRQALELMRRASQHGASSSAFFFHYAVQLGFNGHLADARNALERSISLDPPVGGAFIELARLDKATQDHNHLAQITRALGMVEHGGLNHAALQFALFEELHSLGRHAEAWDALARGNAIMARRLPFDASREQALIDAMIRLATPDFLRQRGEASDPDSSPQPIFVVGLPRSGTTLLERMLGNHSQIASAGELGDFPRALFLAADHLPRGMFDEKLIAALASLDWAEVGRTYLEQTRWRAGGKRFFVDKLPRNWMLAGLIPLALPAARIVHIRRDPRDVCFSNWRACFGRGPEYAYAYDLKALASCHAGYRKLMAHWHGATPGRILDIEHAALTRDPEAVMREVLAFCRLSHEPGCTDPSANATPSATLSMAQVRRGIRTDTAASWQPYSEQLQALHAELATADPNDP